VSSKTVYHTLNNMYLYISAVQNLWSNIVSLPTRVRI